MKLKSFRTTFTGIILIFFSSILFSCKEENKKEYSHVSTQIINIPDQLDITTHADSIFSTLTFVPLETTDECIISFVMNLKIIDSLIYINDGLKRLLVFDSNGKFKYQIGSKGNGPGEYLEMRDYIIYKDRIEILDFKKILTYSLTGEYIKTKHFDFLDQNQYCNADYFTPAPTGGYYFWGGTSGIKDFRTKNKKYLMYHISDDMKIKKGEFLITHGSGSCFYRYSHYKDWILIDPSYGDYNIYQIDNQGEISSRYYFDFGKNAYKGEIPIPDKSKAPQINEELNSYVLEMNNFLETQNWIHIDFAYKQKAYSAFYSKKKDKVYLLSPASPNLSPDEFRFWGALFAKGETLVMPIDASWLHAELNRMSPEYIKKLQLEKYKDQDEFNNPILVYYTLKE
ncbi:6-bladed beta-propeller [Parabacteroides pacaensis]|uniref:6-bladed beta-propeller n=1 Tax=Parabacteroides pacaensis TaxID=2086575 RepID=UPI000D105702|nr:6-bladed beta-propeller [Parabacteroides pacaensis]